MLNLILGILVPLAIRLGVEAVIARFPGLPEWVKEILRKLENEKVEVKKIDEPYVRFAAHNAANRRAIKEVKMRCSGVACPPDLKN